MNNRHNNKLTPELTATSPLSQATTIEEVADNIERIIKKTKSSPTPEVDGFLLVKEDAGLLEMAVGRIRALTKQTQPQENPRSLLSRLSFGLLKGGKKTRKNRGKNKTRRNKNKT